MTHIKARRGKIVHAWTPHGARRDLDPSTIPNVICGKKIKSAVITDENITCEHCLHVIWMQN